MAKLASPRQTRAIVRTDGAARSGVHLSFVDFVPEIIDTKDQNYFATITPKGGVLQGPSYEEFNALIDKANKWLRQNPQMRVLSIETIEIEGVYNLEDFKASNQNANTPDGKVEKEENEPMCPAFLHFLRLWITQDVRYMSGRCLYWDGRPQRIGYRNVMPSRLETNPKAFCPKYETLKSALEEFNKSLRRDPMPGKVISMETCELRFSSRNCSVDPDHTFWMAVDTQEIHCYTFFRVFYVCGSSEKGKLAYEDFPPEYINPQKRTRLRSEGFRHLFSRAEEWRQTHANARTINIQTVDNRLYYKCTYDGWGERKLCYFGKEVNILDNPHLTYTQGHPMHHTKVARLYYVVPPDDVSTNGNDNGNHRVVRAAYKTFHAPYVVDPSHANLHMDIFNDINLNDILGPVNQWMKSTGAHITNVETVMMFVSAGTKSVTAEETHSTSHGRDGSRLLFAIRLYVEDEDTQLLSKDLSPLPKNIKLANTQCTIL